jgi:hypothetical protein
MMHRCVNDQHCSGNYTGADGNLRALITSYDCLYRGSSCTVVGNVSLQPDNPRGAAADIALAVQRVGNEHSSTLDPSILSGLQSAFVFRTNGKASGDEWHDGATMSELLALTTDWCKYDDRENTCLLHTEDSKIGSPKPLHHLSRVQRASMIGEVRTTGKNRKSMREKRKYKKEKI